MTNSLAGIRVMVSGAAGGVGRAVVAALVREGSRICATDINPKIMELQQQNPGQVIAITGDVSKADEVERIYEFAEKEFGGINALVSNAGFIISKSVHETSQKEWDSVLNANAKSFFLMAKRALPAMMAQKSGTIVATGSISGVVGLPRQAAYCASKGALLQLVRQMALDYAAMGIRVNAVGPGSIDTPFLQTYLDGLDDPEAGKAEIRAAHPMGRWAEPEEIAEPIIFLLGAKSSFVTGQMLMVDGGYSAR